jgi:DNA polymerase IIIc chi subunit
MKPEINFYQIDDVLIKSLAPLLMKVLEEKKKVLVFCADQKQLNEIDAGLWTYGRNKFIPHVTIFDKEFNQGDLSFERQQILISNREENTNKSDYLVFLDLPNEDFLMKFSRIFHFFEPKNRASIQDLSKRIANKASKINSYEKKDGKWIKI